MNKMNSLITSDSLVMRLSPEDNVGISVQTLAIGAYLKEFDLKCLNTIPAGHKVALTNIHSGTSVKRYGQVIGYASKDIRAGEHVHIHNLSFQKDSVDYSFSSDINNVAALGKALFSGFKRSNNKVGTRNYIGILSTVNCSATVCHAIANYFKYSSGSSYISECENVDGVVALTHGTGCGMDPKSDGFVLLQRTLAGYAMHPNFGAVVLVGLGCETNQIKSWLSNSKVEIASNICVFNIQKVGGTSKAINKGVQFVKEIISQVNTNKREQCCVSNLTIGLQCGGSDGFSGITANPSLGAAVDELVGFGGTAILSETPEIYGAEHLLISRAISEVVGEKLLAKIRWWEDYAIKHGGTIDNNPSPGNKTGGLTTILEKSLGAVSKSGKTPLMDVFSYAEEIDTKGLVFMDSPGYDPVSVTGQVAAGANIICFTTGRGSAYGCAPAPSLKLATNNEVALRQSEDIDINCGVILTGESSISEMGSVIFSEIIEVASGKKTKSELLGYGQNEFLPWQIGAVM